MTIANELAAQVEANEKLLTDMKAMSLQLESAKTETAKAISGRDQAVEELGKVKISHEIAIRAAADVLAVEQKAHADCKADLVKAQKALANPAFAAAAVKGSKEGVPEGSSEVKDEPAITKANAEVEYKKLTDAKARADFRVKYAVELGLEK